MKVKTIIIRKNDKVQIKNAMGIQFGGKDVRKKNDIILGTVRAIYRNYIYKIQLDARNFLYTNAENLIKI